jgi:SAM-dependent methyltransferase
VSGDQAARFSGRVDDYVKTRPAYPRGVLDVLRECCGLSAASAVCDLGSGTGLFTRLLLESGATVHAVEPNDEMRRAAEAMLGDAPGFRSVDGRAEATTLGDESVDIVTAAQAFHWFDVEATHREMRRVLRSRAGSNVALVWNDRDLEATPFLRAYEELLVRRCPTYRELQGKADSTDKFDALLGRGRWTRRAPSRRADARRDHDRAAGALRPGLRGRPRGDALHDGRDPRAPGLGRERQCAGSSAARATTVPSVSASLYPENTTYPADAATEPSPT